MRPFRRMKIGKNTAFPAVDDKHENLAPSTLVSLNRPLRTNALRLIQKKRPPRYRGNRHCGLERVKGVEPSTFTLAT